MKLSVLILGFISLCAGDAALLGAKECTYGPTYWCGSLSNAKQCKSVKHCIQTVWEKQILPKDNDDVCSICKDMVKQARDQLLSNETQEEIREVFEGSCKLIPLAVIRTECIKLSDEFIPELIDTLASQMTPQAVCSTAGLCNSARVDHLLEHLKEQRSSSSPKDPSPGDCKDCTSFLSDIISTVKRHSRADLLDHLLAICSHLSSLSDGCMALVQSNFQDIYDFFTTELRPNEVCQLFGMCEGLFGKTRVTFRKTEEEPCDFCVAVVKNWRSNLVANTTKEEFKMILDGICGQTGNFEPECKALVDQYFDPLYDFLISEVKPEQICEAFGLCGSNSIFKKDVPIWSVLEMRPENHIVNLPSFDNNRLIGQDEANSYKHNIQLPRVSLTKNVVVSPHGENGVLNAESSPLQDENMCVMCEFTLHFLQNVLQDKKTRKEVEDAVENVCHLLPHTLNEECQDYIEAYGDQVIQLIILEIDPATICPMLKLCPGKHLTLPSLKDGTCALCEYAMTELDQILTDPTNKEAIKNDVEKVCSMLPKTISSDCKIFVDNYINQIVDLIVNGFTPHQICTELGLCHSRSVPSLTLAAPQNAQLPVTRYFIPNLLKQESKVSAKETELGLKQSTECLICEFIMSKIDSMILNNATEKDIKDAFNKVCIMLPTTLMNDCLGFMEEYGNSMIELVVSEMEPSFICRKIHLCKNTFHLDLPKAEVSFPVDKCLVCEEAVEWVGRNMPSTTTPSNAVERILDGVCKHLPGTTKKTCTNLVITYGDYMPRLLQELKDAKHVCQAIKMCPYHGKKTLLGAEKCTWGPSYWCQSQVHADACKATEHCVQNVWGNKKVVA